MDKPINRITLLNITLFVEALLLLAATGWSQMAGLSLQKSLLFAYQPMLIGVGVGCAMAIAGYALFLLTRNAPLFNQIRELVENMMIPMVAELKPTDLIIIATVSGFCEEVFFRGVAQPQFGLVITAIIFGLFHDPSFKHFSYAIIAFVYGLVLGLLYDYTGSLWAPICAHITHNLISLYLLRYRIKPPAAPVES